MKKVKIPFKMEALRFSKWLFAPVFLLVLFLLIPGCSKDDEMAPSNGNNVKLTSKTIGSSGGEIALDSFSITIPPGAFKEDLQLELSVSDRQHPFIDQAVTNLYQVKGIPDEFSESIKILLKYEGVLEEESYIAHGWDHHAEGSDTSIIFFNLIDAIESNGYLEGNLLPASQTSEALAGIAELKSSEDEIPTPILAFFLGCDGYTPKTHQGTDISFQIKYPNSSASDSRIDRLPEYLKKNYIISQSLMHHLAFPSFDIPRKVIVFGPNTSDNDKIPGYFYYNLAYYFNIPRLRNEAAFVYNIHEGQIDEVELNLLIGKAFFHAFQCFIYDDEISRADWFSNATALWMEEKFYEPWGSIDRYVPPKLKGNELVPFNKWGGNNSDLMAPVIKFLVENKKYGEKVIIRFHQNIEKKKSWYEAMNLSIEDPLETWMPDFFKDYMEGEIYGVSGDKFVTGLKGQYDLPAQGAPELYPIEFEDLSAKIYRFNTDKITFFDNAQVAFKAESWEIDSKYLNVLLFSLDRANNKIAFISSDISSIAMVSDIRGLKEEKKDLLAVVVNSYKDINNESNTSDVQFKVELKESTKLTYTKFSIACRHINTEFKRNDGDIERYEDRVLSISMPFYTYGHFTGDEFFADWGYTEGAYKYSGSVLAYVVEEGNKFILTSYDITYDKVSSVSKDLRRMSGGGITLVRRGTFKYELAGTVKGSDIKNALAIDELVRTNTYFNEDGSEMDKSRVLHKIELTSNSELEVIFSDQD